MKQDNQHNLEAAIHRALKSIPDRRAPASLEGRVLRELERRAALHWWRRSYIHWPVAVRAGFFAASAVAAAVVVTALVAAGIPAGAQQLAGDVAHRFAWLSLVRELFSAAGERVRVTLGSVPSLWLYAAGGTLVAFYASLMAIGAATYRTLYAGRQTQ
jgi:hypothetical protein